MRCTRVCLEWFMSRQHVTLILQLTNLRLGSGPGGNLTRGKSHRSDDNLAGGRLSRRAADPAVEAERKAQQERHFALDEGKVERGEQLSRRLSNPADRVSPVHCQSRTFFPVG